MVMLKIESDNQEKKNIKKTLFLKGLKQSVDLFIEDTYAQELFEERDKPITSVKAVKKYGDRIIDFTSVNKDIYKKSDEKVDQEPISTHIKRERFIMTNTIKKELTVSSIFDQFSHVTDSDEMIDISHNSEVVSDVVASLESDYYSQINNYHSDHCNKGTTWYSYVDINPIQIHHNYESIVATEKILNEVKVWTLPDYVTQKSHDTMSLYKLADPHQFQKYNLSIAQKNGDSKYTVTSNLYLLKVVKWYNW